jgi:DNA-binding Lrp family transcriptional regulator
MEKITEVGQKFASLPFVSHCYQRDVVPGWSYNLYTMIHAESDEKLKKMTNIMASLFKDIKWTILESVRELKKTSVNYFPDSMKD